MNMAIAYFAREKFEDALFIGLIVVAGNCFKYRSALKSLCDITSKIGVVAGSMFVVINAFYDKNYSYPATIMGFSLCTLTSIKLYSVQKISSETSRSECGYGGIAAYFICKEPCHSYGSLSEMIYENLLKIGMVAGPVLLTANLCYGVNYLRPIAIVSAGFSWGAWLNMKPSTEPKISMDQPKTLIVQENASLPQDSPPWIEFKRWAPVSEVKRYQKGAVSSHDSKGLLSNLFDFIFKKDPKDILKKEKAKRGKVKKLTCFSEVRAFTNGTNLKYEMISKRAKSWRTKTTSGPILTGARPIAEVIEILKKCFVALENDGTPAFSPSYHTFSGTCKVFKKLEKKRFPVRLELLHRKNDLVWNIYRAQDKKVFSVQGFALSKNCAENTRFLFRKIDEASLNDQINLVKYLALEKCFPNEIALRPRAFPSGFNPEILVSPFMWAVTLIRYEGLSGNHAEIIVEGVNDGFIPERIARIGEYFTCVADLLGGAEKVGEDGKVKEFRVIRVDAKGTFLWRYEARSEIWKRSKEVVKEMLVKSCKERDDPPEGFSRLGCDSVFTSKQFVEHSCITWAIEKLAIAKIVLEKKPLHSFLTYTSFYTPFKPGEHEKMAKDAELI